MRYRPRKSAKLPPVVGIIADIFYGSASAPQESSVAAGESYMERYRYYLFRGEDIGAGGPFCAHSDAGARETAT